MVGRGFRLHEGKTDCLILDYGDNIVRHGPVDAIQIRQRNDSGNTEAPAKECPKCQTVVHAAFANCPDCGFEFPPPERTQHNSQASDEGILTGEVTETEYEVHDVYYHVHEKKNANEGDPRTMRVDYQVGLDHWQSEWVCIEHAGFARQKAKALWRERSRDAFPDSAQQAVRIGDAGGLAYPVKITVRSVSGEKFDRIFGFELGEIPDSVEQDLHAEGLQTNQFTNFEYDPSEIPF